jgi:hypothetical protein
MHNINTQFTNKNIYKSTKYVKCMEKQIIIIKIEMHYVCTMHSLKVMGMHTMPSSEHAHDTNVELTYKT